MTLSAAASPESPACWRSSPSTSSALSFAGLPSRRSASRAAPKRSFASASSALRSSCRPVIGRHSSRARYATNAARGSAGHDVTLSTSAVYATYAAALVAFTLAPSTFHITEDMDESTTSTTRTDPVGTSAGHVASDLYVRAKFQSCSARNAFRA